MRTLFISAIVTLAAVGAANAQRAAPLAAPSDGTPQALFESLSDQSKQISEHPDEYLGDPLKLQQMLHPNVDPAAQEQAWQLAHQHQVAKDKRPSAQQAMRAEIAGASCVVEVFSSLKFVQDNLEGLAAEAAEAMQGPHRCRTYVYVRGLPAGKHHIDDLAAWFMRLEKQLPTNQRTFSLLLDPTAFRQRGVDEYPVAFVRDGERGAQAHGTGSPHFMLAELDYGHTGDLGRVGQTGPIPEQDLIADLQDRMRAIDWDAEKRKATTKYWGKVPQFDLPPASQTKSRTIDMTFRVTADITDDKGKIAVKRGTEVNPLTAVPMRLALCVFDASRPEQVSYAQAFAHRASMSGLRVKYIASKLPGEAGRAYDQLQDALHSPVYILDQQVIDRFEITVTPTVVVADRSKLLVTEVDTTTGNAADPADALPGFDRQDKVSSSGILPSTDRALAALLTPLAWFAEAVSTPAEASGGAACPDAQIFGANLVSSVCWDCIFPMIIAQVSMGDGTAPYERNRGSPICFCAGIYDTPDPGITLSMWQPSNIIELVRHPYCMPTLGGMQLTTGRTQGGEYTATTKDSHGRGSFYQYHMYFFPLLAMLDLFVTENCGMGYNDFDLAYMSEIDPTWNDDELADLLNPESVLFVNPVAEAMCLADAAPGLVMQEGISAEFWCAGTWGFIYPFSGNVATPGSIPRDTSLIATKAIAALHRRFLMSLTMTYPALCQAVPAPTIPKGQYKMQTLYPIGESGSNHWIGQSTFTWGEWRSYPGPGEDFVYLLWRWRDCCDTIYENEGSE